MEYTFKMRKGEWNPLGGYEKYPNAPRGSYFFIMCNELPISATGDTPKKALENMGEVITLALNKKGKRNAR